MVKQYVADCYRCWLTPFSCMLSALPSMRESAVAFVCDEGFENRFLPQERLICMACASLARPSPPSFSGTTCVAIFVGSGEGGRRGSYDGFGRILRMYIPSVPSYPQTCLLARPKMRSKSQQKCWILFIAGCKDYKQNTKLKSTDVGAKKAVPCTLSPPPLL